MVVETIPANMTLAEYVTACLTVPFAWGYNDCVLFAANWVQIATGKNYLPDQKWSSMLQAQRMLKKMGGLESIVDVRLERIDKNFAVDGDIALHHDSLRLFSGPHIVGPGIDGLVFFSRMEAVCAWRCA
jgi:hypothetical protein